jgi:hypothetical protein
MSSRRPVILMGILLPGGHPNSPTRGHPKFLQVNAV